MNQEIIPPPKQEKNNRRNFYAYYFRQFLVYNGTLVSFADVNNLNYRSLRVHAAKNKWTEKRKEFKDRIAKDLDEELYQEYKSFYVKSSKKQMTAVDKINDKANGFADKVYRVGDLLKVAHTVESSIKSTRLLAGKNDEEQENGNVNIHLAVVQMLENMRNGNNEPGPDAV